MAAPSCCSIYLGWNVGRVSGSDPLSRDHRRICAVRSTSTGASRGSTATPTAARAWGEPKIEVMMSLAPFATAGCPVKAGVGGDVDRHFDDRVNAIDSTSHLGRGSKCVKCGYSSGLARLLGRNEVITFTHFSRSGKRSIDKRKLSGGSDDIAAQDGGGIGSNRGRDVGKRDAEAGELLQRCRHDRSPVGRLR